MSRLTLALGACLALQVNHASSMGSEAIPVGQVGRPGPTAECERPKPEWIFCDDFETDRSRSYFEYDAAEGRFSRAEGVGEGGSSGMRARYQAGVPSAGALHLAFGRTPAPHIRPVDDGTTAYREIYWRIYLRNEPVWTGGGGNKLSRAVGLVSPQWAQSVLAPVWSGTRGPDRDRLMIDPASGTDPRGIVRTVRYNDNANIRWLGSRSGRNPLFSPAQIGRWHCIEAHVRLNDPGRENGEFHLWTDGQPDAERTGLNWVGNFSQYGINAVFIENYWNGGAPKNQERYLDRLVVSTARIGCDP